MFFKKKKEEKNQEKKELLYRENIRVNCESAAKEQVIRTVGQMLVDSGYVDQPYVDAMVERKDFFYFYGKRTGTAARCGIGKKRGESFRHCGYDVSKRG